MKKLMTIVVSALCAAVTGSVFAASVTVDSIAALKAALANAVSGDIIELAAGTYDVGSDQILMEGLEGVTVRGAADGKTLLTSTAEGSQPAVLTLKGCTGCTIADLWFYDCAQITTTGRAFGGAVDIEGCADVKVYKCDFRKCFAFCSAAVAANGAYGGAVGIAFSTNAVVDRCRIVGCEVQSVTVGSTYYHSSGGGVAFYEAPDCALLNSVVAGCMSGNPGGSSSFSASSQIIDETGPGGILVYSKYTDNKPAADPRVAISNCLVVGNSCFGAMGSPTYVRHGVTLKDGPVVTTYNTVNSDENRSGGYGAGVKGRAMDISDCTFAWNNGNALLIRDVSTGAKAKSTNTHANNLYWKNRSTYARFNSNSTLTDSGTVTDIDPQFERDGRPTVSLPSGYKPVGKWTGTDLFVDVTTGDDANDGTAENPLKTITAALAKAADGAVITVAAGRYSAESGETFPIDLSSKFGITLRGAGAGDTVLDATGVEDTRVIDIRGSAFIRVEDLMVKGARLVTPSGGFRSGAGANVQYSGAVDFVRCTFTDNDIAYSGQDSINFGSGIAFVSARGTVSECVFTKLTSTQAGTGNSQKCLGGAVSAFKCAIDVDRCIIRDNAFSGGSSGGGGRCYGAVTTLGFWTGDESNVRNCLIANNKMGGASNANVYSPSGRQYFSQGLTMTRGSVVNCTIVSNVNYTAKGAVDYGIGTYAWIFNSGTVEFKNTVVFGHGWDLLGPTAGCKTDYCAYAVPQGVPQGAHDIILAAEDWPFRHGTKRAYQLPPSSPLVDKGDNLDWTKEDVDLAGNSRLKGETVDIGAYEYGWPGLMLFVK